jgi:hypothetical protein
VLLQSLKGESFNWLITFHMAAVLPPFLRGSFISLYVPKLVQGAKTEPCHLGPDLDTPSSEFDLLGWLRVLSNDYSATWGKTSVETGDPEHPIYTDFMRIFLTRTTQDGNTCRIEMFLLRFEPTFKKFELRLSPHVEVNMLADGQGTRAYVRTQPGYELRVDYSIAHAVDPGKDHPWTQLSIRLEQPGRAQVPAAIRLILNPILTQTYQRMRETEQDRRQFSAQLALITGGAVYTIIVPKASAHPHCQQADGEHMFSTVVVFPWAIDLLFQGPQCAMTDTTFKAVHPYTLAVLHLIFANESIPIAFSISPSETWMSYVRIYYLLLERMVSVSEAWMRGETAPPLPGVMPKDGYIPWPKDAGERENDLGEPPAPDEDLEATDEAEYLTLDPAKFPPGAQTRELPQVPAFSPLKPRPPLVGKLALCAPLLNLRIVTDQGTALQKFVKFFQLDWKLCHRHIIESIGAKGQKADWVLRILRCFSRKQFLRTRMIILMEMHAIRDSLLETDEVYRKILWLLGLRPRDNSPLCDINHWALWLRLGCPRTTNSAESVNGHLNAEIEKTETWVERVKSVAGHFTRRYYTRGDWHDRSLKRNSAKCYPDPTKHQSREETEFYCHLHNAVGKPFPQRIAEKLPAARGTLWFGHTCFVHLSQGEVFPNGWEVVAAASQKGATAADEEPTRLQIDEGSAHTAFARLAWEILWSVRKEIGQTQWKKFGQTVNVGIISLGRGLGITDEQVTSEQEAAWRCLCWRTLLAWQSGQ